MSRSEKVDVRAVFAFLMVAMVGLGNQAFADARNTGFADAENVGQGYEQHEDREQLAQQEQDSGIPPSEAAAIARDQVPGAKVVGVKLLSNGWYAVTLRAKGSVTRVMVNAQDGSVR
jgi:uncharacterized membrane protein YkoI